MQAHQETAKASMENQAFYLMARMHVIFRRESNRITDIEYMRVSPDYCRYILELASRSTIPDLQQMGAKLQDLYFGPQGLFARFPEKLPTLPEKVDAAKPALSGVPATHQAGASQVQGYPSGAQPPIAEAKSTPEVAYVGRLR